MSRFFVTDENIAPGFISITGDDVHHIKKVLRLSPGDNITICDCKGNDYSVTIESIKDHCVETRIINTEKSITEPPVDVTIYQGLPKSDKMDFIIQKSIELGVKKIVPVITERTIVKFNSDKDKQNKVTRWQKISLEAAKQCNRGIIPEIGLPVSFEKALAMSQQDDLAIIPYENETVNRLKRILLKQYINRISIFIGPEGGFTEREIQKAGNMGVTPVTLGPRILRTETAGVAVLAMLMYEIGDVNV